jgi:hypothetical protein
MPQELLTEFKALSNELTWLSASWDSFLQLFGPDHGQVALLNWASGFFGIARVSIRNSVFLGICRLTDPPEAAGGRRENLTLERLVAAASTHRQQPYRETLRIAQEAAAPVRSWRNRLIAHADLETMLNLDSEPVPSIPHEAVTFAIRAIADVLNQVQVAFDETSTHYEHVIVQGDGSQVLELMKLAVAHQECIRRGWDSGRGGLGGPVL